MDRRNRFRHRIDLRIEGDGHGFVSSSIRYNMADDHWPDLHEVWPGGSRVMVDLPARPDADGRAGAAFLVERGGNPRISSVEFSGFDIDGLHFVDDGTGVDANPENSYINGKTGIYVASPCDSFRVEGMGMVYLEHGLVARGADALSVHDNFIAECGSCVELRDWGQASKITGNLIGAGYKGRSIYAQRFGGLLVSGNNAPPPRRGERATGRLRALLGDRQPAALVLPGHARPEGPVRGEPRVREPRGRDDGVRGDRGRRGGLVLRRAGRRDARDRACRAVGHGRGQSGSVVHGQRGVGHRDRRAGRPRP